MDLPAPCEVLPYTDLYKTMHAKNPLALRTFAVSSVLLLNVLVLPSRAGAQMASPSAPAANANNRQTSKPTEEAVTLTPFEVKADSDQSYGALNSNSITAFNAELSKLPISANIFTETFIKDTASSTVEDMVATYTAGAGQGAAAGDPSGNTAPQPGDRGSAYQGIELRGLGGTVTKVDGFIDPAKTGIGLNSTFGLERVEVINGPQALLYGNGGAGGVVNLVSKQARFGKPLNGSLRFQIDQYGHQQGTIDVGASKGNFAILASVTKQELGGYRDFIGGDLDGYYLQFAARLFGKTVVRLTGKQTSYDRIANAGAALNAGSAAIDGRHTQNLHYLIATNQLAASATGNSGAGLIGAGKLNWDTVDSYAGAQHGEYTRASYVGLTAESVWSRMLSTQFAVGYQNSVDRYNAPGITYYSPNATANPLQGGWTAALNSQTTVNQEPSRAKAIRFSALLTNDFFGGRAHSQSILGADYSRTDAANIAYGYYLTDASGNVVVNPNVAANNGRTLMPNPAWNVTNGPIKYPLWPANSQRVSYNGNNYVLMIQNQVNPALITANNPLGVTTVGGSFYLQSATSSRGIYGMNNTSWMNDKLNTLLGFRYVGAYYRLASQSGPPLTDHANTINFNVGANYALTNSIRPYFSVSNSYNLPVILFSPNPTDPLGNPPTVAHAVGKEVGIKINNSDGTLSGSLAAYRVDSKNEQYLITTNAVAVINPTGLNGRFGAPSTYIKVNRSSEGLQAAVTATPKPNWRMIFSAGLIKGTIHNSTTYAQVYNDQFYANTTGQVTYRDGAVVYVNSAATNAATATVLTSTAPNATPLTIAMMSSSTSVYYAQPIAISGQITAGSVAATVLKTVDATHGPILTGATGLPISALQVTGVTPPGSIPTSVAGDTTTGYPKYAVTYTNLYTFNSGLLRGFRIGGTAAVSWQKSDYYFYPTGFVPGAPRQLWSFPTLARFDGIFGYEKRMRKVTWSAQANVNNLFNHYHIVIRPNSLSGYTGVNDATFDQQPRLYTFSTTFSF